MNKKIMSDIEFISFVETRFSDMDSARKEEEDNKYRGWDVIDKQVEAKSFYDNTGKLVVNSPLEQNLLETSQGRKVDNIKFNVEPQGEADIEQTESSKYVLKHFIIEDKFIEENKRFGYDFDKYGTAIFFTGIQKDMQSKYKLKKGAELKEGDIRNDKYYENYTQTNRHFCPKNVNIRLFRVDDRCINTPDIEKAEDCFMGEYLSKEEIENRRGKDKNFKIPVNMSEDAGEYKAKKDDTINQQVLVLYYYNKLTKDYAVIVNKDKLMHRGKMLYSDGKLPFQTAQCYTRNNSFYGFGIPKKIGYLKAYKSSILQSILDGAAMTSGINVMMGNGGSINGQMRTSSGEINIFETTGGIDQVQQLSLDGHMGELGNLLTIIDDLIIQDIGDNIKAPYSTPAGTLGEAEIMEENKNLRVKSRDENAEICLGKALTQTLQNIKDFAPVTLKEIKKVDGEIQTVERPKIKIKDVVIKKEGGKTKFEEDYGKYGFFELKPQTLMGDMTVHITTGSTAMRGLKKNQRIKYNEFIDGYIKMMNVLPDEQKQERMTLYPLAEVIEYTKQVFEIDDKLTAQTKKDEIKKKNLEKIEELQELLAPDEPNAQPQNPQDLATQPQGMPASPQGQQTTPQIPGGVPQTPGI